MEIKDDKSQTSDPNFFCSDFYSHPHQRTEVRFLPPCEFRCPDIGAETADKTTLAILLRIFTQRVTEA
jgi:hypothetical protein